MTAVEVETLQSPQSLPIVTEHGTYTLDDLEALQDLTGRARVAASIARITQETADAARHMRDIGALLMIEPFQRAQRPYDDEIAKIDAALEAGKINKNTAMKRRTAASTQRREAMADVVYKPVAVYRDTIGVSRGLFARMQHRKPELPTIEQYIEASGMLFTEEPSLEVVAQIAMIKRDECDTYDAINVAARTIRDEAVTELLTGDKKTGRQPLSNADVARLTGLTTPRIHQLRYGTR
jgi:hypothetical protein